VSTSVPSRSKIRARTGPPKIHSVLFVAAFSQDRAKAYERLSPSLRGSGVSLFLHSRPAPGRGRDVPPSRRRLSQSIEALLEQPLVALGLLLVML
jgi:hypothetical protein